MSREYTNKLYNMMDEGLIDPESIVEMCLSYMSEDDVRGMMEANELLLGEEDEDDENP